MTGGMIDSVTVAAVYLGWLLLGVLKQFRWRRLQWLVDLDIGRLVPFYAFFVNPFSPSEFNWRTLSRDGDAGEWHPLSLRRPEGIRGLLGHSVFSRATVLMHYARRIEKSVASGGSVEGVRSLPEFRAILNVIRESIREEGAVQIELRLCRLGGYDDDRTTEVGTWLVPLTASRRAPSGKTGR